MELQLLSVLAQSFGPTNQREEQKTHIFQRLVLVSCLQRWSSTSTLRHSDSPSNLAEVPCHAYAKNPKQGDLIRLHLHLVCVLVCVHQDGQIWVNEC